MQREIVELLQMTLRAPRQAARAVLDRRLDPAAVWTGFALIVVASAVLGWLTLAAVPADPELPPVASAVSPLSLAMMQAGSILLLAAAVAFGGRVFGGRGDFQGALVLAVWLEFLLLCLQGMQLLLMLVAPPLSALLGYAGVVLFLWLLTNFAAELHGFASLGKVFAGIVAGFILSGLLISLLILLLIGGQLPVAGA